MSDSDNSTAVGFTRDDIDAILSACRIVGAGSPNLPYPNLLIYDLIVKYADWIDSVNYNFTPEDLTAEFGTRPQDAPVMIDFLGGVDVMGPFLVAVADNGALLPHPGTTTIIVPLFIALTVISSIAVVLRIWSRQMLAGGLKLFDHLTILAFFMTVAWGAVAVHHSKNNGKYQAYWDVSWNTLRQHYKIYLILTAFYPWVMAVIKMSLLVLYYQLSKMNYIKWAVFATGAITIGNSIAGFFFAIFACSPVAWWDDFLQEPCKLNQRAGLVATGAIYILTDIATWALPIPLIFQLKLGTREKILAICTFAIGTVACIASGFRLDAILKYQDFSADSSSPLLIDAWTIIELNIALICGCAPMIRALIIFYAPKIITSVSTATTTSKSIPEDIASNGDEKLEHVS
ncbi:hypothetical protein H072_6763 [Dactylellina haptotyla CBS 200.50]|uniref:Rhodopsin domain-containing protein n=1 Tax=Dactylellina haptotyla (strain CBS 200.50) TaxID=1284197 RepID=S8A8V7_DACHA|nr:hypothetical protein H072_6763 [Dactylellina haptotyla CBS 200.50]